MLNFVIASSRRLIVESLTEALTVAIPNQRLPYVITPIIYSCPSDLLDRLEAIGPRTLQDTLVALDLGGEPGNVWSLGRSDREVGLASQLVLAFPEVYTAFLNAQEYHKRSIRDACMERRAAGDPARGSSEEDPLWSTIERHHFPSGRLLEGLVAILALHARGFRTTFDATGLRSLLKLDEGKPVGVIEGSGGTADAVRAILAAEGLVDASTAAAHLERMVFGRDPSTVVESLLARLVSPQPDRA